MLTDPIFFDTDCLSAFFWVTSPRHMGNRLPASFEQSTDSCVASGKDHGVDQVHHQELGESGECSPFPKERLTVHDIERVVCLTGE